MAVMPGLQKQDPDANTAGHDIDQLPVVLPEMQTGNTGECTGTEYNDYQRARRRDAEPIIFGIAHNYRLLLFLPDERELMRLLFWLTFPRGFNSCTNDFNGAFIAIVEHTDEVFYPGIFGRLLRVEDRIRLNCKLTDDFEKQLVAGLFMAILKQHYISGAYAETFCKLFLSNFQF